MDAQATSRRTDTMTPFPIRLRTDASLAETVSAHADETFAARLAVVERFRKEVYQKKWRSAKNLVVLSARLAADKGSG